jgi:hypothetical protein
LTTTKTESGFNARLAVVASVATVLGLFVAIGAWWWPRSTSGAGAQGTAGNAGRNAATDTTPATPPHASSSNVEYLAGPGFPAEEGGALLVSVPPAVRDEPAFNSHAIAIKCPDNRTGNEASEVTYLLRGRYRRFDATVHPYYPPDADTKAASWVYAMVDVRQRDGTFHRDEAGRQQQATMAAPAPLTADIENAEKLTLSVRCADQYGTVVLTDARVTGGA